MYSNVNLVAVLIAAVASMAIGFVWYGPLFGKPWMKLMGMKGKFEMKMDAKMQKTYAMSFVGALVMAYVLASLIGMGGVKTLEGGLTAGFFAWLGFVAPVQMSEVLFGGKSWNLYYINTGFQLASLLAMGAVLTLVV